MINKFYSLAELSAWKALSLSVSLKLREKRILCAGGTPAAHDKAHKAILKVRFLAMAEHQASLNSAHLAYETVLYCNDLEINNGSRVRGLFI